MSTHAISGTVAVLGEFVSSDALLPARYSFLPAEEMARHLLTDISEETNQRVRAHEIIVAGKAFGYGTGRESPARALRAAGVKAVIGGPFGRMFFRNAINNGVLVIDCVALTQSGIKDGDRITIDIDKSLVTWGENAWPIQPVPDVIKKILAAGSLIEYGRVLLGGPALQGAL